MGTFTYYMFSNRWKVQIKTKHSFQKEKTTNKIISDTGTGYSKETGERRFFQLFKNRLFSRVV